MPVKGAKFFAPLDLTAQYNSSIVSLGVIFLKIINIKRDFIKTFLINCINRIRLFLSLDNSRLSKFLFL